MNLANKILLELICPSWLYVIRSDRQVVTVPPTSALQRILTRWIRQYLLFSVERVIPILMSRWRILP